MTGEKTVSVDDQKTTIEALLSKDKMAVGKKYEDNDDLASI